MLRGVSLTELAVFLHHGEVNNHTFPEGAVQEEEELLDTAPPPPPGVYCLFEDDDARYIAEMFGTVVLELNVSPDEIVWRGVGEYTWKEWEGYSVEHHSEVGVRRIRIEWVRNLPAVMETTRRILTESWGEWCEIFARDFRALEDFFVGFEWSEFGDAAEQHLNDIQTLMAMMASLAGERRGL